VRDVEFLRANTDRVIKITLPGPFTMSRQAKNEFYRDEEELVMDYAAAVNAELRDLKAAGADVIQLDEPWLQARGRGTRAALLAMRAHRGTGSSNPLPSSKQSVSRGISPSCIEKPAVAAGCAGPARRHGRQRRAGLVNITPTAGNISVGPYSSTAVPARRFATVVALVRQARSG
jgi:Cobalamin-independent synthase, Catalytic domain